MKPTTVLGCGACCFALLFTVRADAQNTVAGGGSGAGAGTLNLIGNASFAWISGGVTNMIFSDFASVGGGFSNVVGGSSPFSVIGGGRQNSVGGNATNSTISGGAFNLANKVNATVSGGMSNTASGLTTTVGGGFSNTAGGSVSTVGGGTRNTANGDIATIGGGNINVASGIFSTIAGGQVNVASGFGATIVGGDTNQATASRSFVGGGNANTASGQFATIGGGRANTASGLDAVIVGGDRNMALADRSSVGGGVVNVVQAPHSFAVIAGGNDNAISGTNLGVGTNAASSAIGGGEENTIFGETPSTHATISGGNNNSASGTGSTIGGGQRNDVSGVNATIPGGISNQATTNAFAAGMLAIATNAGSFVWSGAAGGANSTNTNSFTVRAPGGARFLSSATGTTNGVILAANGASWGSLSDSNAKTDIEPVNAREVLRKVAALPVTSWHYKHDLKRRYIGPMAQDFHAAFGLGADDKTITTLDTDGVTLAAIKGLVEELEEKDREIAALKVQNEQFKARFQAIDERLSQLPPER